MKHSKLPPRLPPELYRYFWDTKAAAVNPGQHTRYVICRLLNLGDVDAVRWVLRNFPRDLIIETLKTRRDFSPKTATFWAHYLGISREEVKCMQEPYRSLRKQLWPY